jgi:predicted transcriptional regulator
MDTIRLDYLPQVRTLTVELSDTLVAALQELAKSCAEVDAD